MPRFIEEAWEFTRRHGGNGIRVTVRGREVFLFPTGATLDRAFPDERAEPPAGAEQSIPLRKLYRETWLAKVRKDFTALKNAILDPHRHEFRWDESVYGPPPTERNRLGETDWKVGLRKLVTLETEHAEQLRRIEQEYEDLPSVRAAREAERSYREQAARGEQIRDEMLRAEREDLAEIRLAEAA